MLLSEDEKMHLSEKQLILLKYTIITNQGLILKMWWIKAHKKIFVLAYLVQNLFTICDTLEVLQDLQWSREDEYCWMIYTASDKSGTISHILQTLEYWFWVNPEFFSNKCSLYFDSSFQNSWDLFVSFILQPEAQNLVCFDFFLLPEMTVS